jgi:hypothetical protein
MHNIYSANGKLIQIKLYEKYLKSEMLRYTQHDCIIQTAHVEHVIKFAP